MSLLFKKENLNKRKMGQQLKEYYKIVQRKGGFQAAIRLAMFTKISSVKAGTVPDSPENIELFNDSVKQIFGISYPTLKRSS